jgi:branched-subunit amino acid ABC-type transport system permease component
VIEAINLSTFDSNTGSTLLLVVIAAAVFGGVGQPYGAMLGAFVIGMSTELAALVSPHLKDVIAFAILAVMLLVRPNGLIPAPASTDGAMQ